MKIVVTREDIEKGTRGSPCGCPVALAVKRVTKISDVNVRALYFFANDFLHGLPTNAVAFIERFDGGEPVEPFEFEVRSL